MHVYIKQDAWIQSKTIEENILFGLEMDRRQYKETLHIRALELNMEVFDYRDQIEINEHSFNLSRA